MRIQGSVQSPQPQPLRRRKKAPQGVDDAAEKPSAPTEVIRLAPEVDYIAADESWEMDERELSARARRALQGYWMVTHQGRLAAEWHRIDLYV